MSKKKEYIAIISEGEKTEKQIINNLQRNFPAFSNKIIFLSRLILWLRNLKHILNTSYLLPSCSPAVRQPLKKIKPGAAKSPNSPSITP